MKQTQNVIDSIVKKRKEELLSNKVYKNGMWNENTKEIATIFKKIERIIKTLPINPKTCFFYPDR